MAISSDTASEEEKLCLYFGQVRVNTDKTQNSKPRTSVNNINTSSASSCNASPARTQQIQTDVHPMPLYSQTQSIWGGHSLNAGGQFLGSNNLNVHDNGHQPRNLTGEASPSLCNWANQFNHCGNNLYQISGAKDYRSSGRNGVYSYANWYESSGISSDSCMGNNSNQSSLNYGGCHGDQPYQLRSYADIARLAMTKSGSQCLLQSMVSCEDVPLAIDMIFKGVFESLYEVMNDSNGYYVFGKVIESCHYNQLQLIVAKIILNFSTESLISLSISKYGSKSLQRLIKVLEKSPMIYVLTAALSSVFKLTEEEKSVFEQLMTNRTGSFVILKCLNVLDTDQNKRIYEAAVKLCISLAQDEKGCIYLNEFITDSKTPYREKLMDEISRNSKFLSQHPSGNFVVQHVLGLHNPVYTSKICSELKNLYIQLSSQQRGSHVVEKCLNSSGTDYAVNDFLKYDKLWKIAQDQFGNYVIQTALKATKRANSPLHKMLLAMLEQNRIKIQSGFGSKVLSLIDNGVPLD